MFELIVATIILVMIPMLFHHYIVKKYDSIPDVEEVYDNVGSEEEDE